MSALTNGGPSTHYAGVGTVTSPPPRVLASSQALAAAAFGYFFLTMVAYYILKPVREAFFLNELHLEQLPWAHVITSAASGVAAQAYAVLAARTGRRGMVIGTNLSFIACILGFWLILGPGAAGPETRRLMAWVYYVWVSLYGVFSVTVFWSLAHDIFDPSEGRRLYGRIGAGGVMGAAVGGWLTHRLTELMGAIPLLILCALVLVPCLVLGLWLDRSGAHRGTPTPTEDPPMDLAVSAKPESVWRDPYVRGIAVLVVVYQCVAVLVDYQTKSIVQSQLTSLDDRVKFFGHVYEWVNILALGIQLGLTGPLQTHFGPLPGLLSLPLVALLGSILMPQFPVMPVCTGITIAGLAVTYSIHQTSKELLYGPTGPGVRLVAKGVIDTFLFRTGNAAASVLILVWHSTNPVRDLALLVGPLSLGWMVLATRLSREYQRRAEFRSIDR